jgi:hypothetical protein
VVIAHRFGHASPVPSVRLGLKLLDDSGIEGEMRVRDVRVGRVETMNLWGRTESFRQEFKRLRAQ